MLNKQTKTIVKQMKQRNMSSKTPQRNKESKRTKWCSTAGRPFQDPQVFSSIQVMFRQFSGELELCMLSLGWLHSSAIETSGKPATHFLLPLDWRGHSLYGFLQLHSLLYKTSRTSFFFSEQRELQATGKNNY